MVSREIEKNSYSEVSVIKKEPQCYNYLKTKTKTMIIKEFVKFIDEFKDNYQAEFLIRDLMCYDYRQAINRRIETMKGGKRVIHYDLLNKDRVIKELSEKAEDKKKILAFIRNLGEKYNYPHFDELLRIFNIICDIKDFALGGTLKCIKKKYGTSHYFVFSIAQVVFSDNPDLYKNRFYQLKYLKPDLLSLTKDVSHDQIIEKDFPNLENRQLQDVLNYYRKKKQIVLGSNLFRSVAIDFDFTRWLKKLPPDRLNMILKFYDLEACLGALEAQNYLKIKRMIKI